MSEYKPPIKVIFEESNVIEWSNTTECPTANYQSFRVITLPEVGRELALRDQVGVMMRGLVVVRGTVRGIEFRTGGEGVCIVEIIVREKDLLTAERRDYTGRMHHVFAPHEVIRVAVAEDRHDVSTAGQLPWETIVPGARRWAIVVRTPISGVSPKPGETCEVPVGGMILRGRVDGVKITSHHTISISARYEEV